MDRKKQSDSAELGAQERLERLLVNTERPDTTLLTLTVGASQLELGQASRLIREVLAQVRAENATLRDAALVVLLYGSDANLTDLNGAPIAEGTGPFAALRRALADTNRETEKETGR